MLARNCSEFTRVKVRREGEGEGGGLEGGGRGEGATERETGREIETACITTEPFL